MSTLSGWAVMNDSAAFFAAARRLGTTSVAVMLPETSMAKMTVPEARDTGTDATGPATAIVSTATPAMVNHTPPSRARPRPGPPAVSPAAARDAARPGPPRRKPGRGEGRGPPPRDDDRGPGQDRGHEQADRQENRIGE